MLLAGPMLPAVFVNRENGEVVIENVTSRGITLAFGEQWYAAAGILDGAWLYVSLPPDYDPRADGGCVVTVTA